MTVQTGQDEQFTFVAGLNTEASYFTFPKNTWKEGDNLVPNLNGTLKRRICIDLEDSWVRSGSVFTETNRAEWAFTSHKWSSVGGKGDDSLIVVQCGRYIYFYSDNPVTTSETKRTQSIDLDTYKATGTPSIIGSHPVKCVSTDGKLLITSRDTDPILVERTTKATDLISDVFTVTRITISMRDFDGVQTGFAIDYRPPTENRIVYGTPNVPDPPTPLPSIDWALFYKVYVLHRYNLYNQGWPVDKVNEYGGSSTGGGSPVNTNNFGDVSGITSASGLTAGGGYHASTAQSWVYGKNSDDDFSAAVLDKQDFGTSKAPTGRFVLQAFNKDRQAILDQLQPTHTETIPVETETNRPSTCAFFAGRAWYAGIESVKMGSHVFFSQIATDAASYGKCYQQNDPTSEVVSDLLDTDGGVIPIQDCGQIIDIRPIGTALCIFATNGVWAIKGTTQEGFAATGYEVVKLSSLGCISRGSIVDCNDFTLYWSFGGICKVGAGQGGISVESITDTSIRTFYTSIPALARKYSSGKYNDTSKTVMWLYNGDNTALPYQKTRALILDLRLGAFYTYSFPSLTTLPVISDAIVTDELFVGDVEYNIITEDESVVIANTADPVVANIEKSFTSFRNFKFLTIVRSAGASGYNITFSDFLTTRNAPTKFYDWYSVDNVGVSFSSYLLTGYSFAPNGPSKAKQGLYVTTYMQRTETGFDAQANPLNESSCYMSGRWDFTDSTNAGKWSQEQQVYRHKRMYIPDSLTFDDGYPVVVCKSKVRGRGKSLQLYFRSEPNYDLQLMGWSVPMYGGTNV